MSRKNLAQIGKFLFVVGAAICAAGYQPAVAAKAQIVTFDPQGSIGTYPWASNNDGTIVGFWYDSVEQVTKGFIRAPDGTITSFDHADSKGTAAYGLNSKDVGTGDYTVVEGNHPALIRQADGTLAIVHAPGDDSGTFPIGITNKGAIAGSYYDLYSVPHGFLRNAHGKIVTFDVKGDIYGTNPMSINAGNVIAGHYTDGTGFAHGFARAADGKIRRFDAP